MPFVIVHFPDVQPDSLRCQQAGHDSGDKTMLNMIAVVGQGDGLQPCGFVAARWSGMVPARKQAVRREPVCLVLLFRMVDKIGRRQHVADPLADSRVCPTVGAAVKEEIVAALLQAALHGLFSGGGAFKRQPAAQVFIEIRQYPHVHFVDQRPIAKVVIERADFQLVAVIAGDGVGPGANRQAGKIVQ